MEIVIKVLSVIVFFFSIWAFFIWDKASDIFYHIGVIVGAYTTAAVLWIALQTLYEWIVSKIHKEK